MVRPFVPSRSIRSGAPSDPADPFPPPQPGRVRRAQRACVGMRAGGGVRASGGLFAILALATGFLLAACGLDDAGSSGPEAPEGTPMEVAAAPRLVVGESAGDPAHLLDRIVTPFLLADGRLVVPLGGPQEIRLFDERGGHVATHGRTGEGPGEFTGLSAAWARGDTIEAWDSRIRRLTRILPDGGTESVALAGIPSVEVVFGGPDGGGWFAVGIVSFQSGGRDSIGAVRIAADGSVLGEVGPRVGGLARGTGGPGPLTPRAVARVDGGRLYLGDTALPELHVIGTGEDDGRVVSWEPGAPGSPSAMWRLVQDSAADRVVELWRGREVEDDVPASVFWDFVTDELGFVWVRPFDPLLHAAAVGGLGNAGYLHPGLGEGGEWWILSPEGERVGSVQVPEGVSPVQITRDELVGIRRDDLGVESVRVYPLVRK